MRPDGRARWRGWRLFRARLAAPPCVAATLACFSLFAAALAAGCGSPAAPPAAGGKAPVFISVISDIESNPQAVDMALKLAGFSLDEGRSVFLFFNVKGVRVPLKSTPDDAAFTGQEPFKKQLADVIARGATAHSCIVCMKALHVAEADLAPGVEVTNRAALFARVGPDTAVFTY